MDSKFFHFEKIGRTVIQFKISQDYLMQSDYFHLFCGQIRSSNLISLHKSSNFIYWLFVLKIFDSFFAFTNSIKWLQKRSQAKSFVKTLNVNAASYSIFHQWAWNYICDAFRDLVSWKTWKKNPCRSVTFKESFFTGVLHCESGTKSRKASDICFFY